MKTEGAYLSEQKNPSEFVNLVDPPMCNPIRQTIDHTRWRPAIIRQLGCELTSPMTSPWSPAGGTHQLLCCSCSSCNWFLHLKVSAFVRIQLLRTTKFRKKNQDNDSGAYSTIRIWNNSDSLMDAREKRTEISQQSVTDLKWDATARVLLMRAHVQWT